MFRDVLSEVVSGVEGALGAVVMGADGILVDQVAADPSSGDIEALAMELSVVLREVRKAAQQIEAGATQEVMVRGATLTTLIRVLNDEYFVALALASTASVGKGRFLLRRAAPRLSANL